MPSRETTLISREDEETYITEMEQNLLLERKTSFEKKNQSSFFKEMMNMPIIASIVSLSLCIHPGIQSYFSTPKSLLNETILSVNKLTSKGYGFLVMFLLGVNFSDLILPNTESARKTNKKVIFNKNELAIITFTKLIIMPIIASPFVIFLFIYGIINDDVMVFLFLFMAAAPNAINVIVLCSVKNAYVETVSIIMVVQYIASIFTLTFQISLIIWFLSIF